MSGQSLAILIGNWSTHVPQQYINTPPPLSGPTKPANNVLVSALQDAVMGETKHNNKPYTAPLRLQILTCMQDEFLLKCMEDRSKAQAAAKAQRSCEDPANSAEKSLKKFDISPPASDERSARPPPTALEVPEPHSATPAEHQSDTST